MYHDVQFQQLNTSCPFCNAQDKPAWRDRTWAPHLALYATKLSDCDHCYLVQVLIGLANASSSATDAAALRQSVPEDTVVGIFRDLRGIVMATNSRRTYGESAL